MTSSEQNETFEVDYWLVNPAEKIILAEFLSKRDWLKRGESLEKASVAGEGRMNLTLRLETSRRSFILKQSRPWVESRPTASAPDQRIVFESVFYEQVREIPALTLKMPRLLGVDRANRIMLLTDLGDLPNFTFLYDEPDKWKTYLPDLLEWLSLLHRRQFPDHIRMRMKNREMQQFMHDRMFVNPFQGHHNEDLERILPGLGELAEIFQKNEPLLRIIGQIGDLYLQEGNSLIHGDFTPLNWLKFGKQVRIIDPEYAFFGRAEFDLGNLMAHFLLSGREIQKMNHVFAAYKFPHPFSAQLAWRFCGVALIQQLIGFPQVKINRDLAHRGYLLSMAEQLVQTGNPLQ